MTHIVLAKRSPRTARRAAGRAGTRVRQRLSRYVLRFTFYPRLARSGKAFTLVEILVVIALAAVLATMAVVSLAGSFRTARAEDVAGQVANYDRLTREWVRRFGRPARLTFDLDRGTVHRSFAEEAEPTGGDRDGPAAPAPARRVPHRAARIRQRVGDGGRNFDPLFGPGQTPTYAVLLAGPKGERQWLVTAGLTGKVTRADDDREVQDLFRTLPSDPPLDGAAGDDAR